jgi:hypothetical protein
MADKKNSPKTTGQGGQDASDFDANNLPAKARLQKKWKESNAEAAQQGGQSTQGGSGGK